MWPFRTKKPPPPTPDERFTARLEALSTDLATIRREWDAQQLDYGEVLAKLARWAGRQAARERKTITTALEGEPGHNPDGQLALLPDAGSQAAKANEKARLRRIAATLRGKQA
jgi:hypothetical protein